MIPEMWKSNPRNFLDTEENVEKMKMVVGRISWDLSVYSKLRIIHASEGETKARYSIELTFKLGFPLQDKRYKNPKLNTNKVDLTDYYKTLLS